MRFTNARVKAIENETGKAQWFHDDELTGLAITVSPRGKKTWYVNTWANGRTYRERIGTFPGVNASEAREKAKVILGELAKGNDHQRKAKARNLTVGDLWAHWYENHSKQTKRTWKRDAKDYEAYIRPVLHHVRLSDVERSDIENLLTNTIGEHSLAAGRRTRGLLSAMFEYGINHEWIDRNPVRKTPNPTYEPRQRYLKESEVKAFFQAVGQLRSETARDFILLSLWTGQRRENVASMEWNELNLANELWVIPAGKYKGKRENKVALSEPAMQILNRRQGNGSKYVFPSRGAAGHYKWPRDAWRQVLKKSRIENLQIHDLRRSLGAWMNEGGDSLRIIQQALGHSNVSITAAIYTPTEVEAVRKSVEAVASRMLEAAKGGEK